MNRHVDIGWDNAMSNDKPMTNKEIVAWVIKKAGGAPALADAIGIRPQAVYKWTRIPAERAVDVERVTGIRREQLRPDVFRRK